MINFDDKVNIEMFPANAGDCILIEFEKEDYRILIDGGYVETYNKYLRNRLLNLSKKGKRINLLVITHIDNDHIGGIQAFLKENGSARDFKIIEVDEVWYNSFSHINEEKTCEGNMPYIIKEMLRKNIVSNNGKYVNGKNDISVVQGNTVSGLLKYGEYNWNNMWNHKSVCTENGCDIKLTENIKCKLLNPGEKELSELIKFWFSKMKSSVKNFGVYGEELYNEAFESYWLSCTDTQQESIRKNICCTKLPDVECKIVIDNWEEQMDRSITNRSSIAFLIQYEEKSFLFTGDSPIQLYQDELPKKIDVVKLPHHGSEKNINRKFIENTEVSNYLLSTDGKSYGHPSPLVVASIMKKSQGKNIIIKNYDI